MTRREFFKYIAESDIIPQEYVDFAKTEIEKMNERNDKRKDTPTAKQKENAEFADTILQTLDRNRTYYAKDIATEFGLSPQKAATVLKSLTKRGFMVMTFDEKGKRAYTFAPF